MKYIFIFSNKIKQYTVIKYNIYNLYSVKNSIII